MTISILKGLSILKLSNLHIFHVQTSVCFNKFTIMSFTHHRLPLIKRNYTRQKNRQMHTLEKRQYNDIV